MSTEFLLGVVILAAVGMLTISRALRSLKARVQTIEIGGIPDLVSLRYRTRTAESALQILEERISKLEKNG